MAPDRAGTDDASHSTKRPSYEPGMAEVAFSVSFGAEPKPNSSTQVVSRAQVRSGTDPPVFFAPKTLVGGQPKRTTWVACHAASEQLWQSKWRPEHKEGAGGGIAMEKKVAA